eukprot:3387667-Amphidinium_carterae.1
MRAVLAWAAEQNVDVIETDTYNKFPLSADAAAQVDDILKKSAAPRPSGPYSGHGKWQQEEMIPWTPAVSGKVEKELAKAMEKATRKARKPDRREAMPGPLTAAKTIKDVVCHSCG